MIPSYLLKTATRSAARTSSRSSAALSLLKRRNARFDLARTIARVAHSPAIIASSTSARRRIGSITCTGRGSAGFHAAERRPRGRPCEHEQSIHPRCLLRRHRALRETVASLRLARRSPLRAMRIGHSGRTGEGKMRRRCGPRGRRLWTEFWLPGFGLGSLVILGGWRAVGYQDDPGTAVALVRDRLVPNRSGSRGGLNG